VGKAINDLALPEHFLIALVIRGEQAIIPKGTTILEAGDEVVAVTSREHESLFDSVFSDETAKKR
jgi:NhaP-type Na+/H+ and K+/H+ antiporter